MTDELFIAAKHILRIVGIPNIVDNEGRWYEVSPLAKKLADAYLAEHPADDDEPLEFGTAYERGDIRIDCCACNVVQSCLIIYDKRRRSSYFFRIWNQPVMPTRGDVRRLLDALGIEVKK